MSGFGSNQCAGAPAEAVPQDVGIGSWRKSSSTREQGIAFEDFMEIRLES